MERFRASPRWRGWLFALAILASAPGALAASLDIDTLFDATVFDGRAAPGGNGGLSWNLTSDGYAGENQEIEPGMLGAQVWDLEGMFVSDANQTLTLVGGWDFISGLLHDGDQLDSGDIFLARDVEPTNWRDIDDGETTNGSYQYILDVDWAAGNFDVVTIGNTTTFDSVTEGGNIPESDPWRMNSIGNGTPGAQNLAFTLYSSAAGELNSAFDLNIHELGNQVRYAVQFDLGAAGLWFLNSFTYAHFTYECGNDLLHGQWVTNEGGSLAPEPATFGLLGLAIGAVGLRRKLMRK
jgi:hypothetical protein